MTNVPCLFRIEESPRMQAFSFKIRIVLGKPICLEMLQQYCGRIIYWNIKQCGLFVFLLCQKKHNKLPILFSVFSSGSRRQLRLFYAWVWGCNLHCQSYHKQTSKQNKTSLKRLISLNSLTEIRNPEVRTMKVGKRLQQDNERINLGTKEEMID